MCVCVCVCVCVRESERERKREICVKGFGMVDYWCVVHFLNSYSYLHRVSSCNRVKKNQIDAHLVLSIFRQPLHVSGVSRLIIRRYNLCIQQLVLIIPTRTTNSHLKRITSTNCIHMVVPPDDGPRYARNM